MARNFVEKGLLVLACSIGVSAPSFAAASPASNPTSPNTAAAPAASTTATTTTTTPSSTTTNSTTTVTTAAPAAAAAAPAASTSTTTTVTPSQATSAAPAATTPGTAPASATSSTTTTTTSAATPAASTSTTTTTTDTPKTGKAAGRGDWPASWVKAKEVPADNTNYVQTYPNAIHSECVLIAEYLGHQKADDARFNQPIQADYKIIKILKGPPLNKRLPIKYEFHDHTNPPTPANWKFSEKEMPAVGSRWLIFIEHAVPHNGQFETYEGNWGRQPENEDNLNKVYELLEKQGETGY